ncbi:hypothetical protein Brms1b_011272 [Colletotrichum noveboracense]|nr:Acyl-coenzyme A thioesterase 8 [Colletotrichum sp. SAR 10_75]KAJ0304326.1 hypothetical protein Brms1b_011272 [Colletotrichum noveboracense]
MATGRSTIVRPPPEDPNKSPIENVLEVTELGVLGPDIFTNTRQPWHPPGARGIFGGAVIAQCLASAQKTVPNDFFVHSCHCYFLLAGSSEIPILFHVERVRDGRSFATRTVQARQRGRLWRFPFKPEEFEELPPELREQVERLNEFEGNTEGGVEYWKTRPHLGMMGVVRLKQEEDVEKDEPKAKL